MGVNSFLFFGGGEKSRFFLLESTPSHADTRTRFVDQRSPQPPEEGVLGRQTHANRHCDSRTESAHSAHSVKIIWVMLDPPGGGGQGSLTKI